MKRILSSPDGTRLLLLCAEADSVLLLDAGCGLPLVLARAGLNPQNIALDETGDVLAVAAGESGEVLLMSARSLTLLRRLSMPGMVFDVTLCGGTVHALCLNDALDATLVTVPQIGARQILPLPGMPGRVTADGGRLLCATEGFLHAVSRDGMRLLHTEHAPGRAGRLPAVRGRYASCSTGSANGFLRGAAADAGICFAGARGICSAFPGKDKTGR